jgi:hypothetical protein
MQCLPYSCYFDENSRHLTVMLDFPAFWLVLHWCKGISDLICILVRRIVPAISALACDNELGNVYIRPPSCLSINGQVSVHQSSDYCLSA